MAKNSEAFVGVLIRERETWKGIRKGGNEGTPLSNYAETCKCTCPRSIKEVADSEELSVAADPLTGGNKDKLATFSIP